MLLSHAANPGPETIKSQEKKKTREKGRHFLKYVSMDSTFPFPICLVKEIQLLFFKIIKCECLSFLYVQWCWKHSIQLCFHFVFSGFSALTDQTHARQ